jgi:hypothetical protein
MSTAYVLIMVLTYYSHGLTTVTQEFTSLESCEAARKHVALFHETHGGAVKAQGCHKK